MATTPLLRILVAGLHWPPETFLARLIRGLLANDIEVTAASSGRPGREWMEHPRFVWLRVPASGSSASQRLPSMVAELGGAVVRSASGTHRFLQAVPSNGSRRNQLRQLHHWLPFAGRRWDVIYFPWNAGAVGHLPLFDLAPVVVSCRGAQINIAPHRPGNEAYGAGLRETFRRAAAVHCVSEAIAAEARQYGLDPARTRIIRPAVSAEQFRPPAEPRHVQSAPLKLVTTGSLIWRKGYETMLVAVRRAADAGVPVHLDIIGEGLERERVLYTVDDLDLGDQVTLCGRLAPDKVAERLQAADVFILASLSEGISNAVLEGMACGLPVITTCVGGMDEAVRHGVEGFLVPSRDPAAMAKAIVTLWEHPDLRLEMGEAARRRIVEEFQLEGQIDAFVDLLRSMAV